MRPLKWVSVVVAMGLLLGSVSPARTEEQEPSASDRPEVAEKKEKHEPGYVVGGAVLTVVNIPLRGALCVGSTAVAGGLFLITFGTSGRATAFIVKEACGGPWVITPEILKGKPPRKSD